MRDIETIVPERKSKMPVSRDVSKDLTVNVGDTEFHRAISKSTDVDIRDKAVATLKGKPPIPVMYGMEPIPPGPYTKEDVHKYMKYTLEHTSADTQQIDKVMNVLDYFLTSGFSTFV